MSGYADELSVKLTAQDEMSARLKAVRKELTATEKAMVEARREFDKTGAPEAAAQLKRLETQYDRLAGSQRDLAKSSSQLRRDLERLRGEAGRSTSAMGRLGGAIVKHQREIQRTGLVMGAALAFFAKGALQRFSSVEDASSALSATFEATGDAMIDWAKRSGDAMNMSQGETLDALMTFSGYARSAGLEGQKLAKFSQDLVARSADLASYYGGTTADAISAIGSALRGEAEPARRYQIFVDDAALKAEYFAQTGEKVNGTLTMQQKILASSSLIMAQSAVAQGDLARTADSTANTLKDATQQWQDFQAAMGETVAKGVVPFLSAGSRTLRMLSGLPSSVQQAAFAVTALGIAAMIATPRLIAFNLALKGIGISAAALGPIAAILVGGTAATMQAYEAGEKFTSGQKTVTETVSENTGVLGFAAIGWGNLRSVIDRVTGSTDDSSREFSALRRIVAQVTGAAASATPAMSRLASAQARAAATAQILKGAQLALARGLAHAERILARRDAMRTYRQALKSFIEKPSTEAGDAVSAAMLGVANSYKDPEKRARFVKRSYKEIESTVAASNLPSKIQTKITTPLSRANRQALALLASLRNIDRQVASSAARNSGATEVLWAAGGPVRGPGTGTSDSIRARLSNGEYVIRAAAARSLGMETLNRLNYADRAPALPSIVNAPVITLPADVSPGRDAPLVGHMVVNASSQVDVELALLSTQRRADRARRTRTAGSR